MEEKLKKGQLVYIDNQKYVIINMIEFKEDTWIWQEYEIVNDLNEHKWLSIEKGENNTTDYWIYKKYYGAINEKNMTITENGIQYELYEKGIATVKNYFGNADVDMHEKCNYTDYISQDKKKIISIERWEGEVEKSQGEYIDSSRIVITNEIDTSVKTSSKSKATALATFIIISLTIFPIFAAIFAELAINKSMQKYLEGNSNYTYVTSVTNNSDNKIAKVYKSPYATIDETVKNIIDGVPEGITDTIDSDPNTEEDGIGLHTDKEFAYIYKEDGIVYVQVSSKKYASNNGSTYHSRHRNYYYRTFRSTRRSSTYSSYSYSARQQSINSRKSSGGGTSSGK